MRPVADSTAAQPTVELSRNTGRKRRKSRACTRSAATMTALLTAGMLAAGCAQAPNPAPNASSSAAATTTTATSTNAASATATAANIPEDPLASIPVSNCKPAPGATGEIPAPSTAPGTTPSTAPRTSTPTARAKNTPENLAVRPEIETGYRDGMRAVKAENFAVATANPIATKAACEVLRRGGNAADAAVTAQLVLGLVEPQSSGLGGGGYILYHDAAKRTTIAIDGRETAPKAATETYLTDTRSQAVKAKTEGKPIAPQPDMRRSGRSIGVPGMVAALGKLHEDYGKKSWVDVVNPAQRLAAQGFIVSPRMAQSIADAADDLAASPAAAAYFLDDDKKPLVAGTLLRNRAYADVLAALAEKGPEAFYTGPIAADIVAEARRANHNLTPSLMTMADMAAYRPEVHDVLCAPYRGRKVCGMPPSSSGGVTVLETLRLLEATDLAALPPTNVGPNGGLPNARAVHTIADAQRLAYADRDAYIGDPAFTTIPGGLQTLLSDTYIAKRRQFLNPQSSLQVAGPGDLGTPAPTATPVPEHGTTHISVIDGFGNAASVTSSVEAAFGSFHFTRGFVLNNQLTDFDAKPTDGDGRPLPNRVQGGKRPRSSMSPLIVFSNDDAADRTARTSAPGDRVAMVLGSPGGSLIIQYVTKTLVNILDWGMNPQQAVAAPNFGAMNKPDTVLGSEHPLLATPAAARLRRELEGLGHSVLTAEQTSGLSALVVTDEGIIGGADPRREGIVLGG